MAISLESVSFSYSQGRILSNVDLTLDGGLIHLVCGPTGSGKSTIALLIVGLLKPEAGRITVDGVDPASKEFDRSSLQLAFQFPEAQIFEITVEREIAYGLKNFGIESDRARRRIVWAIDCVGLARDLLRRDPNSLSFGERRRVALASVIALRPRYLVLDEPLAGLDWQGRLGLLTTIGNLKTEGIASVILTHETEIVGEIGDTVTVLKGSRVFGTQDPDDFLYPPREPDHGLLPDYIRTLRRLNAAGFDIPGRPRSAKEVALVVAEALGFPRGQGI